MNCGSSGAQECLWLGRLGTSKPHSTACPAHTSPVSGLAVCGRESPSTALLRVAVVCRAAYQARLKEILLVRGYRRRDNGVDVRCGAGHGTGRASSQQAYKDDKRDADFH